MEDTTRAVVDAKIGLAELTPRESNELHRILRKVRVGAEDFDEA